jgi:hypothetical protein
MSANKKTVATLTESGKALVVYFKTERQENTNSDGVYIPKPWYSMYLSERLNEIDDTTVQIEKPKRSRVASVDTGLISSQTDEELLKRKPRPKPTDDDAYESEIEDGYEDEEYEERDSDSEEESVEAHYESAIVSDSYDDEAEA